MPLEIIPGRFGPLLGSYLCLFVLGGALLSFAGCSKSVGDNRIQIKLPAIGEKDHAVKSAYTYPITKTFTDINGKMTTAASYRTYVANYDLDAGNFAMTLDKPLASEEQVRVVFSLVGDEGTNDKSPPKAGTYSAKADKFMKVEDVSIVTRRAGNDNKVSFDRGAVNGSVSVTSASADTVSGDIDLTSGDTTVKGSFTAKVLKHK